MQVAVRRQEEAKHLETWARQIRSNEGRQANEADTGDRPQRPAQETGHRGQHSQQR